MPKVTVIIPTYNRADYICAALDSVLAQTYRDYNVIVVDNGSTDNTKEVLDRYMDRIRYVHQENKGRAGARNTGIRLAKGQYIAFLDSDDIWLPDKLERQVAVLDKHHKVGMVSGHIEVINKSGQILPELTSLYQELFRKGHTKGITYSGYALECYCLTSTILVRSSVFEEIGVYDLDIRLEDLDLYLRIALDYEILFLDENPLTRYRRHDSNTANDELALGQIQVCLKHLAIIDSRPDIPAARLARRNFYLTLARSYNILSNQSKTRYYILKAIESDRSAMTRSWVVKRFVLSFAPQVVVRQIRKIRRKLMPTVFEVAR